MLVGLELPPFLNCGETITSDLANYRGTEDDGIDTIGFGDYDRGPKGIYRLTTTPVDTFPPNAFGLYDMHAQCVGVVFRPLARWIIMVPY